MPFKSEKQRRYLWLKHPEVAKRWAHEYPNQKKLPMYAHNNDKLNNKGKETQKEAQIAAMSGFLAPFLTKYAFQRPPIAKKIASVLSDSGAPGEHGNNSAEIFVARGENCEKTLKNSHNDEVLKAGGIVDVLKKYAAVIRLGSKAQQKVLSSPSPQGFSQTNLVGARYQDFLRKVAPQIAQSRANTAIPPPIGSQPAPQPSPVAAYPGMNSAPAQKPAQGPNASHSPFALGNDGILNTIGKLAPFKVENGQIAKGMGHAYGNMPNTPTKNNVG